MAETPFKIQMNQDGAILKTSKTSEELFLVMPDYIKLEKASYPRMTVNPIEMWTEDYLPPEDYGKNIIDDTFEESWYYTFYCDTTRTSSKRNGSFEEPYTDFYTAIALIKYFFDYLCCNASVRLIVKGKVQLKTFDYSTDFNGLNFIIDCSDAEFFHKTPEYPDGNHGTSIGVVNAYIYNLKISYINNIGRYPLFLYRLRLYNLTPTVGTYISSCIVSKINKPINDIYINGTYEILKIGASYIKNMNNIDFTCGLSIDVDSYIAECILKISDMSYRIAFFDSNITLTYDTDASDTYVYRSGIQCSNGCLKFIDTYIYESSLTSYLDLSDNDLEHSVPSTYFELEDSYIFNSEIKNTLKLPLDTPNDADYYLQKAVSASYYNKISSIKNSHIVMNGTLVNRPTNSCVCIGYGAVDYLSVRDRNLFIIDCELSETVLNPVPETCDRIPGECEKLWL